MKNLLLSIRKKNIDTKNLLLSLVFIPVFFLLTSIPVRAIDMSNATSLIFNNQCVTLPSVKIKLKDKNDITQSFNKGTTLSFKVIHDNSYHRDATVHFYNQNSGNYDPVQQLDLNDGRSADDLNMPNMGDFNVNNSIEYVANAVVRSIR